MNRYEVHTYTLCQGWINCWMLTDENGNETSESFPTIKAAQIELDEFFADIDAEMDRGERATDEGYDRAEYRIYDVIQQRYVA